METKTKYILGLLTLILLVSGVVYISFENLKIRVDNDKTTFYVQNDNNRWVVSGREYNSLFSGSTKLNRNKSSIKVNTEINEDSNEVTITRTTSYIRGPRILDTYKFQGNIKDVELFPISHTVEIFNGEGYFYRYEVRDLDYSGPSEKLQENYKSFGKNMKVEWQSENKRWARVYKSGILKVQYDIPSDYEKYAVRLSDPPISSCGTTISSAGTYSLTQNLSAVSSTCITITGDDVIFDLNGFGIYNDTSVQRNIAIVNADNVTIRNYNGSTRNTSSSGTGVRLEGATNIILDGGDFNHHGSAISWSTGSGDLRIINSQFSNNWYNLVWGVTGLGNLFIENVSSSANTNSRGLIYGLTNPIASIYVNNVTSINHPIAWMSSVDQNNITIKNSYSDSRIFGTNSGSTITNSTFVNNTCASSTVTCMLFDGGSENIVIDSVNISNYVAGITLNDGVNNVTIRNSNFSHGYGVSTLGTIYLQKNTTNILIEDNTFFNTSRSVYGNNAGTVHTNLTFRNNFLNYSKDVFPFQYLINSTIENNIHYNSRGDIYEIQRADNSIIRNEYEGYDVGGYSTNDVSIRVRKGENNQIYNNVLNSLGSDFGTKGHGIMIGGNGDFPDLNAENFTIYNNTISGAQFGLLFHRQAHNNLMYDNLVYNSAIGIYFIVSPQNNILRDSTFLNNTYGIRFYHSTPEYGQLGNISNNTAINVTIEDCDLPIAFTNLNDTVANNSVINATIINGGYVSIQNSYGGSIINTQGDFDYISLGGTSNLIVTSSSYGYELVTPGSNLTRKWWYAAYVNDTNGNPLNNVNVSANDVFGNFSFNLTTDVLGFTQKATIIDYINESGTTVYHSNYVISASNGSYSDSHEYNVTSFGNKLDDFFTINFFNISISLPNGIGVFGINTNGLTKDRWNNFSGMNMYPLGQTITVPIFNVTNLGGDVNITLNHTLTNNCMSITVANNSDSNNSILLSSTSQVVLESLQTNSSAGLWSWINYTNCSSSNNVFRLIFDSVLI